MSELYNYSGPKVDTPYVSIPKYYFLQSECNRYLLNEITVKSIVMKLMKFTILVHTLKAKTLLLNQNKQMLCWLEGR